jgi:hypothetical protein
LILHVPFPFPLNIVKSLCIGHQLYDTSSKSASDCGWIYSFLASSCRAMRWRARGLASTSVGDLGLPRGACGGRWCRCAMPPPGLGDPA